VAYYDLLYACSHAFETAVDPEKLRVKSLLSDIYGMGMGNARFLSHETMLLLFLSYLLRAWGGEGRKRVTLRSSG
jgi:hypothetical protein